MEYAIILRKIELNDEIYYQGIKRFMGIKDDSGELKINDSISCPELFSENDLGDYAYIDVDPEDYEKLQDDLRNSNMFLVKNENYIEEIKDIHLKERVKYAFHNKYHDFDIVKKYDLDKVINDIKVELKNNVKGQDEIIDNILSKIYNNQMFIISDLSQDEISKYKTNVLVMGPHGTGKSLILDVLKNNLSEIPIIKCELTGDVHKDLNGIIRGLITASSTNVTLAERGIVLFDSMKEKNGMFSEEGENLFLEEVRTILEQKELYSIDDGEVLFDYSNVTNILMFDIDYKEQETKDGTYYSKVDFDTLLEYGFDPHFIYDLFNEEIIYMNEMNYELAYNILKDSKLSPLYKIKEVFEKNKKKLKFDSEFIEQLINQGLELGEGFQGIIRLLNYLTQKKNMTGKIIEFSAEDLKNLKVGTSSFEEYSDYEIKDNKLPKNDQLKVDLEKRTINGLTVSDAVKNITAKIKGQDEQTFRIVNALYRQIMDQYKGFNREEARDLKASVLLMGGTGVGKTAILEKLATIFNIPFVREDVTRFSGTGIVGADVEDIIKDLIEKAHGDKVAAEHGIVFLDEFDKLAANAGNRVDIGGDVQKALLTLLEGAKISIRPGVREEFNPFEFDTTNNIFFAGGAFDGIKEIAAKRVLKEKGGKIGFSSNPTKEINKNITTEDVSEFGIDSQLAGRFPVVVSLNNLDEDILLEIINSEQGFINLNRKSYEFEGVKLTLSPEFKKSLARKSFLDKKGARSIKTIFSEILDNIDMERTNNDIEEIILDENSIENPKQIKYIKRK